MSWRLVPLSADITDTPYPLMVEKAVSIYFCIRQRYCHPCCSYGHNFVCSFDVTQTKPVNESVVKLTQLEPNYTHHMHLHACRVTSAMYKVTRICSSCKKLPNSPLQFTL